VAAADQPLDSSVSHLKAVSQANLELVLVDIRKNNSKKNKSSYHFLLLLGFKISCSFRFDFKK
jgi:hypothetical protein